MQKYKVRPPVVAGQFYPGSAGDLKREIAGYLNQAALTDLPGAVKALIVPHAGYVYSGLVAAYGYKALKDSYKRVFVLASNHARGTPPFKFSVPAADYFETPLGRVKVSSVAPRLLESGVFTNIEAAYDAHVIEVQLPFLQTVLADFEIVPIVTGWVDEKALREAARVIAGYVDADTLIVVSSDLSHYHPYEEAVSLDRVCIKALEDLDMAAAARCEACGLDAAAILLSIARERGWKGKILDYRNSGDTAGSKAQVVGYSAIAYYTELGARRESPDEAVDGERGFSEMEKRALLRLSRETLHVAASGRKLPKIEAGSFPPNLHVPAACFVTLHKRGQLRGCIGHLVARMPLYECVVENTVHAALHDGRFDAVVPHELSQIEIEVSVLSPPLPVNEASRARLTDLLAQRHPGVIISRGPYQSTFLPQVWEQLPDTEHFLSNLCRKAGMESRCWQDSATQVSTYDVTAFNEHQPG